MSTIRQQGNDRAYRNYLASKSWECPEGGSHYWLPWQEDVKDKLSGAVLTLSQPNKWRCKKCGQQKAIEPPIGHWSQSQVLEVWASRSSGRSLMQQVVLSELLEN